MKAKKKLTMKINHMTISDVLTSVTVSDAFNIFVRTSVKHTFTRWDSLFILRLSSDTKRDFSFFFIYTIELEKKEEIKKAKYYVCKLVRTCHIYVFCLTAFCTSVMVSIICG